MKKRGSLSLSVNAIVVFILAFAMLGVGLFFINTIREKLVQGATGVFDINQLKNPPTSDRPIVISNEVAVKKSKTVKLEIGFYNKLGSSSAGTHPVILECRDTNNNACLQNVATYNNADGTDYDGCSQTDTLLSCAPANPVITDCLPAITSPIAYVPGGEGKGFKVALKEKGLIVNSEYICTLGIVDSSNSIKETESFHLSVVS